MVVDPGVIIDQNTQIAPDGTRRPINDMGSGAIHPVSTTWVTVNPDNAVQLVAAGGGRSSLTIQNQAGGDVWLLNADDVEVDNGILLTDGREFIDDSDDAWWAIGGAAVNGDVVVVATS